MVEVRGIIAQFLRIRHSFSLFLLHSSIFRRFLGLLRRISSVIFTKDLIEGVFILIAYIDFKTVGSLIRTYRQKARLSQQMLAEKIEVSTNYIGNIERAVSTPSATTLFRIALALDITMNDLLNEETVIWYGEDKSLRMRSPDTVFCNTLSDWLLLSDEEAAVNHPGAPANPIDLSSIGFLMLDEDFSPVAAH